MINQVTYPITKGELNIAPIINDDYTGKEPLKRLSKMEIPPRIYEYEWNLILNPLDVYPDLIKSKEDFGVISIPGLTSAEFKQVVLRKMTAANELFISR